MKLKAGEAATVAVALSRIDPMAHGMRGLPSLSGNPKCDGLGNRAVRSSARRGVPALPPPARDVAAPGDSIGPA